MTVLDTSWWQRAAATRREEFHLAGTEHDHDQSSHAGGSVLPANRLPTPDGEPLVVLDDPPWGMSGEHYGETMFDWRYIPIDEVVPEVGRGRRATALIQGAYETNQAVRESARNLRDGRPPLENVERPRAPWGEGWTDADGGDFGEPLDPEDQWGYDPGDLSNDIVAAAEWLNDRSAEPSGTLYRGMTFDHDRLDLTGVTSEAEVAQRIADQFKPGTDIEFDYTSATPDQTLAKTYMRSDDHGHRPPGRGVLMEIRGTTGVRLPQFGRMEEAPEVILREGRGEIVDVELITWPITSYEDGVKVVTQKPRGDIKVVVNYRAEERDRLAAAAGGLIGEMLDQPQHDYDGKGRVINPLRSVEQFHLRGRHDQQAHGNWAERRQLGPDSGNDNPDRFTPVTDWGDDEHVEEVVAEFCQQLTAERDDAVEYRLESVSYPDETGTPTQVDIEVYDHGVHIGDMSRRILPSRRLMYADNLTIHPDHQGRGIGTHAQEAFEDLAAGSGVETVKLLAVAGGRYVWARAGYDWDIDEMSDSTFGKLAQNLVDAQNIGRLPNTSAVNDIMQPFIDASQPGWGGWVDDLPTPFDVSEVLGRDLMLDIMPTWDGVKKLRRRRALTASAGRDDRLAAVQDAYREWARRFPIAADPADDEFELGADQALSDMVNATAADIADFHLAGRHDQKTHGNRNGGVGYAPGTSAAQAATLDQIYGWQAELPEKKSGALFFPRIDARKHRDLLHDSSSPTDQALAAVMDLWGGDMNGVRHLREQLTKGDSDMLQVRDLIRNAAPTDIELYRGMTSGRSPERWAAWNDLEPGDTINFDQLGSFTEAEQRANSHGRVRITMQPGARALPIETISNTPMEREWLVAGDVRVVSVTPTGPGAEAKTTGELWAFDDREVGPGFDIVVEYIGPNTDPDQIGFAAAAGVSAVDMITEALMVPMHLSGPQVLVAAAGRDSVEEFDGDPDDGVNLDWWRQRLMTPSARRLAEFHLAGTEHDHDQSSHAGGKTRRQAADYDVLTTIDGPNGRLDVEPGRFPNSTRVTYHANDHNNEIGGQENVVLDLMFQTDDDGNILGVTIDDVYHWGENPEGDEYRHPDHKRDAILLVKDHFDGVDITGPNWDEDPGPRYRTPLGQVIGEIGGFKVGDREYRIQIDESGSYVKGEILNSDGDTVGRFERDWDGYNTLHNQSLIIEPWAQGKGIGTTFTNVLESAAAEKLGAEVTSLTAGGSVGKYAWAARGYEATDVWYDSYDYEETLEAYQETGEWGTYNTATGWLLATRDYVDHNLMGNTREAALERLDRIPEQWEFDGVYPGYLIGVDPDIAKTVLLDGPQWEGQRYIADSYPWQDVATGPIGGTDEEDPNQLLLPLSSWWRDRQFHLQGQHDQKTHGNRHGVGVTTSPIDAITSLLNDEVVSVDGSLAADIVETIGRTQTDVVNLTNLDIVGHPIFREAAVNGIRPRADMPQIPASALDEFQQHLSEAGIAFETEVMNPLQIKATQTELDAVKTGQMMSRIREGTFEYGHQPWVSSDGFILDGHHRWAAFALLEAAGLDFPEFAGYRVGMPIRDLLAAADEFNDEHGVTRKHIGMSSFHLQGQHDQKDHGRWARSKTLLGRLHNAGYDAESGRAKKAAVEEIAQRMADMELTDDNGNRYSISIGQAAVFGGMEVMGSIMDREGRPVASFHRAFVAGNDRQEIPAQGRFLPSVKEARAATVEHKNFKVAEDLQGQGIGDAFTEASMEMYAEIGVERIELVAAEVGRYAWAAQGYRLDPTSPTGDPDDYMRGSGVRRDLSVIDDWTAAAENVLPSLPPAEQSATRTVLDRWRRNPDDVYGVDLLAINREAFKPVFLNGPEWHGYLDLKDDLPKARTVHKPLVASAGRLIEEYDGDPDHILDADWIKKDRPGVDVFHLKGTEHDHDQSTHARGSGVVRERVVGLVENKALQLALSGIAHLIDVAQQHLDNNGSDLLVASAVRAIRRHAIDTRDELGEDYDEVARITRTVGDAVHDRTLTQDILDEAGFEVSEMRVNNETAFVEQYQARKPRPVEVEWVDDDGDGAGRWKTASGLLLYSEDNEISRTQAEHMLEHAEAAIRMSGYWDPEDRRFPALISQAGFLWVEDSLGPRKSEEALGWVDSRMPTTVNIRPGLRYAERSYPEPMFSTELMLTDDYTVTHEMGHATFYGQMQDVTYPGMLRDRMDSLYERHQDSPLLSGYGRTSAAEAHAESFTEWVNTGGTTNNPVVRDYAASFGWLDDNGNRLPLGAERDDDEPLVAAASVAEIPRWLSVSTTTGGATVEYIDVRDGVYVLGPTTTEAFHLAGTEHDHDQSTHAGASRRPEGWTDNGMGQMVSDDNRGRTVPIWGVISKDDWEAGRDSMPLPEYMRVVTTKSGENVRLSASHRSDGSISSVEAMWVHSAAFWRNTRQSSGYRNRPVGFLSFWEKDGRAEVLKVDVHPSWRRQGIATEMWKWAKQRDPSAAHSTALTEEGRAWNEYLDREGFHLKGTQYDHDQSSHAPGRRIAPVSGEVITASIATDLTMDTDAINDDVKKKIRARLESALGVTPEEGVAHLVHMAELAHAKGLPGRDWYQTAHDEAIAVAEGSGIDPEVAVAITAALSPGTPWDENRRNALHLMEAFGRRDEPLDPHIMKITNDWGDRVSGTTGEKNATVNARADDTFNTLYERDPRVAAVYLAKLAGASVGYSYDNFFKATELMVLNNPDQIDPILKGAKVRSFYNNLARPRGVDGDVTVDIHMQRAMANDTGFTTPEEKYNRALSIKKRASAITGRPSQDGAQLGAMPIMADMVRDATVEFNAANGLDLQPHEFQAVVWTEQISQYPPHIVKQLLKGRLLNIAASAGVARVVTVFVEGEDMHLKGAEYDHDQSSHAGGGGLGYDPNTEMPKHRPGEAPIPEGAVRLTHRTWTKNVGSILHDGLETRDPGDGSGQVVWAAAGVGYTDGKIGEPWQAESDVTFFEFWMMPDELIVGNRQDPSWLEQRNAHVTMQSVSRDRFVGAYMPWHAAVWAFESRTAGTFEEVRSGFYDNIGKSYPDTYGKAIDYIKAHP